VALVTWVLVIGIKESAWVNSLFVAVKVVIVLFFIIYGSFFIKPQNWIPFAPSGFTGIMGGAAIVFSVLSVSMRQLHCRRDEESAARHANRHDWHFDHLHDSLCGRISCIDGYTALPNLRRRRRSCSDCLDDGRQSVGPSGCFGRRIGPHDFCLVSFPIRQPRIFMAMARDGLLPKFFCKLHPKYRTPFVPTILTGLIVAVSGLCIDIGQAAELTNIGTLAAFMIVCAGVTVCVRQIRTGYGRSAAHWCRWYRLWASSHVLF